MLKITFSSSTNNAFLKPLNLLFRKNLFQLARRSNFPAPLFFKAGVCYWGSSAQKPSGWWCEFTRTLFSSHSFSHPADFLFLPLHSRAGIPNPHARAAFSFRSPVNTYRSSARGPDSNCARDWVGRAVIGRVDDGTLLLLLLWCPLLWTFLSFFFFSSSRSCDDDHIVLSTFKANRWWLEGARVRWCRWCGWCCIWDGCPRVRIFEIFNFLLERDFLRLQFRKFFFVFIWFTFKEILF